MLTQERETKKLMYNYLFGDDGSVTMAEFTRAFEAIIEQILKFEKKLLDKNTAASDELKRLFAIYKYELGNKADTDLSKIKQDIAAQLASAVALIERHRASIKPAKDGKQGPLGPQGIQGPQGLQGDPGLDGSPDAGEDIIKKVNKDKGDKKIKKEKVEGLNDILAWFKSRNQDLSRQGLRLYNGGLVATIVAGSGITVDSTDPGQPIITATGSAGTRVRDEDASDLTLAHTPIANTLQLFRGGARQSVVNGDYTIVGAAITLTTALETGETLTADYDY